MKSFRDVLGKHFFSGIENQEHYLNFWQIPFCLKNNYQSRVPSKDLQKKNCQNFENITRVPNNRAPPAPPRMVNFLIFFSTQDIFIPTPILLIFSHFCSYLYIAIFIIVHRKEKEIVQSNAITMNYVNTENMLSLWDPIVGMSIVKTYVMRMITKLFGRIYVIKILKFHRFVVFLY